MPGLPKVKVSVDVENMPDFDGAKTAIRKGGKAYLGLFGLAYDRFQSRQAKARARYGELFGDFKDRGEAIEKDVETLLSGAQHRVAETYAQGVQSVKKVMPGSTKKTVQTLEAQVATLTSELEALEKAAKSTAKTVKKKTVKKVKDAAENVETTVKADTPSKKEQPRHIPYFEDVKRYDPLAAEDVVRKIVNHCGIALQSEDARYVACSDESERATVRDSWLKRKLGLEGTDMDLDKKVMEICDLMQRDRMKNRVTFYYLLAKKERKLDTL